MDTVISSAQKTVVIGPDHPFVIIGERINPTGRKVLTAQMIDRNMSMVCRDARRQVEAAAHILDVNAGVPVDGVEPEILQLAINAVQQTVDVPISIDSSVVDALAAGLSVYEGKALVNSVTYEEERLETVLPLVKKYGAAVVGVANDDSGISNDPQERLRIATLLVERAADHGIPAADVVIDPLALTVSADDNACLITLETIRLVRENLGVNMTCGASNISFGLPWRPAVNAAFLSMAIAAGLTSAITNPLEAEIRRTIYAADLLMGHDAYAGNLIQAFRAEKRNTGRE